MVESEETVSQEFPLLTRGLKRKGIKRITDTVNIPKKLS